MKCRLKRLVLGQPVIDFGVPVGGLVVQDQMRLEVMRALASMVFKKVMNSKWWRLGRH